MYEYHITVTGDLQKFKTFCILFNVKPLLIDLKKTGLQNQLQCTFHSKEANLLRLTLLCDYLKNAGFYLLRTKTEVEYNPNLKCEYYEAHVLATLDIPDVNKFSELLKKNIPESKISSNVLKSRDDGKVDYWITIRSINHKVFIRLCEDLYHFLQVSGIQFGNLKKELVLVDTNTGLDEGW